MGRDGRLYKTIAIGPSDKRIGLADLPPANLKRWGSRQKAIVVVAVESALISLDEACARYRMSPEEFLDWERALAQHGLAGLKLKFREQRHQGIRRETARTARDTQRRPGASPKHALLNG